MNNLSFSLGGHHEKYSFHHINIFILKLAYYICYSMSKMDGSINNVGVVGLASCPLMY
jgi:hypothetical protein